jgi:DNA processing protein
MDLDLALSRARLVERGPRRARPEPGVPLPLRVGGAPFRCADPVRAVGPLDDEYPPALHLPPLRPSPPALFVRGRGTLPPPGRCVALIGARRCTSDGRVIARGLARGLVEAGVTVVSGLALGIDAAAHEGAVDAGGTTVAVLASPVDRPTPAANRGLGEEIVASGGWLVSERAPDAVVRASEFPRRNRLVVALCDAVVVVEAGLPSGTLGTVSLALAAGRAVGAVPGSVLSPASAGSNALLAAGATPILGVADALALLSLEATQRTEEPQDPDERAVLGALPGASGPAERWIAHSGLAEDRARSALLRLVARGALRRDGVGGIARCLPR